MDTDNMRTEDHSRQRTLEDYLAIIRRRKWIAIVPVLLVPIAAYLYSWQQPATFAASSEVLLSRQDLGSTLSGVTNADIFTDADRFAQTQAALARVPEVARRAVARSRVRISAGALMAASSVTPRGNADLLQFTVKHGNPAVAAKLATAYAQVFSQYRLELDTENLAHARADLQRSLTALRRQGATDTQLYNELTRKSQELRTMELLQTKPRVVRTPSLGSQVAPTPRRNAMLGAALGLLFGLAAAFLWEALDKRVRDEDEIVATLDLPLLARVPAQRSGTDGSDQLSMLQDPGAPDAEAFRRLRSNIEFANLDVNAKAIMVTSAVGGEGKSQTVANLAIALARSGRRVALVDLDLRMPSIGRYFGLGLRPGITDVVIERVGLEQALVNVPLRTSQSLGVRGATAPSPRSLASTIAASARPLATGDPATRPDERTGTLWVLPAGFLPANPGEFVGTHAVAGILGMLKAEMDFVLVDSPPLVPVSDAATISTRVDAILVVTRLGLVNRPMLRELAREMDASPAHKLGLILTGAEAPEHYGAAYGQPAADKGDGPVQQRTVPFLGAPAPAEDGVPALGE